MRALLVTLGMAAVQALVVAHWWWWPGNVLLATVALVAGLAMAAAALLSLALLVRMLRLNPLLPAQRPMLVDYAAVEKLWAVGLLLSTAFAWEAWRQGVTWVVAVVALWMGVELAALVVARLKLARQQRPGRNGV